MKKYVYLFELDSVRKTDKEIMIGQKALYDEIVGNGNIVVLTYNQFVDSRGFFSLFENTDYYDSLVGLFESGYIKLSQYSDVRSISQYLINSLSYERSFIYSGWPLKSTQKRLLALIRRSLMYSDLTEIDDYIEGVRVGNELLDLFVEVDEHKKISKTALDTKQCMSILKKIYYLLKTILRLSLIKDLYVIPKKLNNDNRNRDADQNKEINMSLPKYLQKALSLDADEDTNKELWIKAVKILKNLKKNTDEDSKYKLLFDFDKAKGPVDRSYYHHAIKRQYENSVENDITPYQYAEAIVDLCYNYQLEYSICNSSKHYNISEFQSKEPSDWPTFTSDFFSRLKQTWDIGDLENRYLLAETNIFDEYKICKDFPDFKRAVRIVGYTKKDKNIGSKIHRYEHDLKIQRKRQKGRIEASIGKKLIMIVCSLAVACILELTLQSIQNYVDSIIPWNFVLETIVFLIGTEFITWGLSKLFHGFLSLSEAVGSFARLMGDMLITISHKVSTYLNGCEIKLDLTEDINKGVHINYVRSEPLKRYMSLQSERKYLFSKSDEYPIVDFCCNSSEKDWVLKNLMRQEELFGYQYGVVYTSKFNTMVVDPIDSRKACNDDRKISLYFPYERVVPTSGTDGVVMIPKFEDKYILIKQYRHAIRSEQYSFPRGYAEQGGTPEANAVRELREELNAEIIINTTPLCRVAANSGLTSTQAHVYLVEIGDYSPSVGHEGIIESVSLTESELDKWIKEGKINDGFTLSAWSLLKDSNIHCTL